MNSTYTPLAIKAAAMSLEEALPLMLAGPPRLRHTLHVCRMYRRMAIGFLLVSGVPTNFFGHLYRSGRAYLHFLDFASDLDKATAKGEPFFDAVACNDTAGAGLIATRSRASWNPDEEYEDDFLYVRFLMGHFFLGVGDDALRRDLAHYEAVLEGASDRRFDVCMALLNREQRAFDEAVEAFIGETTARFERDRQADRLDPDDAATLVHVSTELLAWLRFADMAGLRTNRSYKMAPAVTRRHDLAQHPSPDSWQRIGFYREIS